MDLLSRAAIRSVHRGVSKGPRFGPELCARVLGHRRALRAKENVCRGPRCARKGEATKRQPDNVSVIGARLRRNGKANRGAEDTRSTQRLVKTNLCRLLFYCASLYGPWRARPRFPGAGKSVSGPFQLARLAQSRAEV